MEGPPASLRLCCLLMGQRETVFSLEIAADAYGETLQTEIKEKRGDIFAAFQPSRIHLYVAKTSDNQWLSSGAPQVGYIASHVTSAEDLSRVTNLRAEELDPEEMLKNVFWPIKRKQVHVLIAVPMERGDKRDAEIAVEELRNEVKRLKPRSPSPEAKFVPNVVCASDWFPKSMQSVRVQSLEEGEDDMEVQCLEMRCFPPLAHPMDMHSSIFVRDCYTVIFDELMATTKQYLGKQSTNLLVTGNPGIGKSRFYVYCAFRLMTGNVSGGMPEHTLVLNYGIEWYRYWPTDDAFKEMSRQEIRKMKTVRNVIRLVEAESDWLMGWRGVSILFASPGVKKLKDFVKSNASTYISPVWSFEELHICNALLSVELKLSEDELASRYSIYGGVPRQIFKKGEGPSRGVSTTDEGHQFV